MRNVLDLQSFCDWLGKQPAEMEYDWLNPKKCALAQYVEGIGGRPSALGWFDRSDKYHEYPRAMREAAFGAARNGKHETFGAAHTRALALLRERS